MTRWLDTHILPDKPNLEFETALWEEGCLIVGGIDEAGRGAWAGPVSAAVVVLPVDQSIQDKLAGVNDSKLLTADQRNRMADLIREYAREWKVGTSSSIEIDEIGILQATRLAMMRAIMQLISVPDHLLIDYLKLPSFPVKQTPLIKGDARSLSIASASILAKTYRDAIMISLDAEYPGYGFKQHKGYGTAMHRAALLEIGACAVHRKSFRPVSTIF